MQLQQSGQFANQHQNSGVSSWPTSNNQPNFAQNTFTNINFGQSQVRQFDYNNKTLVDYNNVQNPMQNIISTINQQLQNTINIRSPQQNIQQLVNSSTPNQPKQLQQTSQLNQNSIQNQSPSLSIRNQFINQQCSPQKFNSPQAQCYNSCGPTNNSQNNLQFLPSIYQLWQMSEDQLQQIQFFQVKYRNNYIKFLKPLDLRGVQLDKVFQIRQDSISVDTSTYPQFNAPADICMQTQLTNAADVAKWCYDQNIEFIDFDGSNRCVTFRIQQIQ